MSYQRNNRGGTDRLSDSVLVKVTQEERAWVESASDADGVSMSAFVRRLICEEKACKDVVVQ